MSSVKTNSIYDLSGGSNAVLYGVASPPNSMGFRNRIINGDCRIDQRNAGASVTPTNGGYTLDRWFFTVSQASKLTCQQNAGSVTPPAGFTKYLGVTSSSAYTVGASEIFLVRQSIEGLNSADLAWGTASAQTVTLSARVYSSLTGTFGGVIRNGAGNRFYPFSYTISSANTWTQISVTIPGDTTGTWATDNSVGIDVMFSLGTGSTLSGTAGSWGSTAYYSVTGATSVVGTNGATFYITGVQLEAGSVASPFERRDYGRELMMCQRYLPCFDASNGFSTAAPFASAFTTGTSNARAVYVHKVTTRVPPTGITVTSASSFSFASTGGLSAGGASFAFGGVDATVIDFSITGATAGQGGYVYAGSSSCKVLFTGCEL